jgi:hypothetical protein
MNFDFTGRRAPASAKARHAETIHGGSWRNGSSQKKLSLSPSIAKFKDPS